VSLGVYVRRGFHLGGGVVIGDFKTIASNL